MCKSLFNDDSRGGLILFYDFFFVITEKLGAFQYGMKFMLNFYEFELIFREFLIK